MKKYLVIGNPIEHSFSPNLHNYWFKKHKLKDCFYEKMKIEENDLENIIDQVKNDEIQGVNVTVPFKRDIIPFLDTLDEVAKATMSVNTICKINNKIWGYNTDVSGFKESLNNQNYKKKKIFILGAGGVTPSVVFCFLNSAEKIYISNRTKKKAEEIKRLFSKKNQIEIVNWGEKKETCDIVVNTTSVGLKNNEKLDLDFMNYKGKDDVLFYDIIYNPEETDFLKKAKLRGNNIMNGKMMFLMQAQNAFKIWTGISPKIDDESIKLLSL